MPAGVVQCFCCRGERVLHKTSRSMLLLVVAVSLKSRESSVTRTLRVSHSDAVHRPSERLPSGTIPATRQGSFAKFLSGIETIPHCPLRRFCQEFRAPWSLRVRRGAVEKYGTYPKRRDSSQPRDDDLSHFIMF